MSYATCCAMQAALIRLRETDIAHAALASELGYESEAAFSRAFKRVIGVVSGAARRIKL